LMFPTHGADIPDACEVGAEPEFTYVYAIRAEAGSAPRRIAPRMIRPINRWGIVRTFCV